MRLKPCVFFDRDGIVNESPAGDGYVLRPEEFRLIPAFPNCLRVARRHGYAAAVVTNQRCMARGLLTPRVLAAIHRRLRAQLARAHGLRLLAIAVCPHAPGACDCRKPQPGLLLKLAARHGLDLGRSWMVGDKESDVEAGRRAGCRTIRVGPLEVPSRADVRVAAMSELPARLAAVLCHGK